MNGPAEKRASERSSTTMKGIILAGGRDRKSVV